MNKTPFNQALILLQLLYVWFIGIWYLGYQKQTNHEVKRILK